MSRRRSERLATAAAAVPVEDRAERMTEDAARQEEKGERYTGEDGYRAFVNAAAKYREIAALPGLPPGLRTDALHGVARCQWRAADRLEGSARAAEHLQAALDEYEALLRAADGSDPTTTADTLCSTAQVLGQLGEHWADRGQAARAEPCLRRAVELADRGIALVQSLPDAVFPEPRSDPEDPDADRSRLGRLVDLVTAAAEALTTLARATGTVDHAAAAVPRLAAFDALDTARQYPASHILWAAVLTQAADVQWQLLPAAQRHAGALPRALLDEAVAKASAALQSPEVDPVECLCGRSDTLVTYADMVIDADRLHSAGQGPAWDGPSAVALIQRAAADLETALQLETEDQRALLGSMGDAHLSLFQARPDPQLPSVAGQPQALVVALDWYRRALSVPFKPYRSLETAYNVACACALLGPTEDARCLDALLQWLQLLTERHGSAAEAAALARTELSQDGDFAAFLQRPRGQQLWQQLSR